MKIAIIGCGQLARMLALAGWPMGFSFHFLAVGNEDDASVQGLGKIVRFQSEAELSDSAALYKDLGEPDVVTIEKEHVDVSVLRGLQKYCSVAPNPDIISICQHRGREKTFLNSLGIKTAPFRWIKSKPELQSATAELGFPVFVKSCEHGYDGQNQWRLEDQQALKALLQRPEPLPECVVEGRVNFKKEISIIVVAEGQQRYVTYPLTENLHRNGTLLSSIAPASNISPNLQQQANDIVSKLLQAWNYVGVLAIECFISGNEELGDELLVNELAPRVHNSGHWTQGSAATSQFENHLRAITGLTLGATQSKQMNGMLNLLGCLPPAKLAIHANSQLHLYNKTVRPGRKLGHINLQHANEAELRRQLNELEAAVYETK